MLGITLAVTAEIRSIFAFGASTLRAYAAAVPQDALGAAVGLLTTIWAVAALAAFSSGQIRQALARLEEQHRVQVEQSARERALLAQMLDMAGHIQSTARTIATAAQQADGAHTQAESITHVTGTVEELSATAGQIADSDARGERGDYVGAGEHGARPGRRASQHGRH